MNKNLYVVLMAGGVGVRFWPYSRNSKPKQFLDVLGTGKTLLQSTYDRFAPICPPENIYVVTHEELSDLVKEQLPLLSDEQIVVEPIAIIEAGGSAQPRHPVAQVVAIAPFALFP